MGKEEEFYAKLLNTFRNEAEERIQLLTSGLISLEGSLDPHIKKDAIEQIFREVHNLKGASRAVNHPIVEAICQEFENVLSAWKKGDINILKEDFTILFETVDCIEAAISQTQEKDKIDTILIALQKILNKNSTNKKEELEIPITPQKDENFEKKEQLVREDDQSIRISLSKLNELFQLAEEMLMVKLISQKQEHQLKVLYTRKQGQKKNVLHIEEGVDRLIKNIGNYHGNSEHETMIKDLYYFIDALKNQIKFSEDKINQLMKGSEQNYHFIESQVNQLLQAAKKILMQPISSLFDILPRMIRDIAHQLNKEISIEFQGKEIELDRRIIDEIKDPIIHLIRNAIDHGIESSEEREALGKSPKGKIKVIAHASSGNHVAISIIDDGRGIETEKIKSTAVQKGLLSQKESDELSVEDIHRFAMHSGISTSPNVTQLSGRGLGLPIVSEKVDQLGGQVSIESQPHQGTKFTLTLPLTLATFRGVHFQASEQDFIMPLNNLKRVIQIKKEDISTVANQKSLNYQNSSLFYIPLSEVLGLKNEPKANQKFYALIVTSGDKTVAFGVDKVLYEAEVLVKNLGQQCLRVKNIMAATILEQGKVVPILHPLDLIKTATKGKITDLSMKDEEIAVQKKILLVEDSMTTRLMLKNILESANYEVLLAVDGIQALELLASHSVDLILTDIEMPRMDGFTLLEKIRSNESFKNVPVIILTSRESADDHSRGISLGANGYLGKKSFSKQVLVDLLTNLIT